jgi:speckle-type POZ protein
VPAEQFVEKYVTTRGYIEFRCTIRVLDDGSPNTIPVPPPGIATHLGALLDTADGADVSFTVDGETFRAHRAVVAARSPVLPSIALHDIAPDTFTDVLRFLYTDTLARGEGHDDDLAGGSSRTKMLECLLAAADRYALDRLKLLCAQKLWDDVSAETVASTLACAQMYSCPELKEKCIKFFVKENNFKKAVLTEGFVELVQQFPSIIIELPDNVAT